MRNFLTFIQDIFMMNSAPTQKVGLSQFKNDVVDFSINKNSITNQNIKLSDLLRRS